MATTVRKGSDRPGAKKAIRKTARKAVAKKGATKNAAARKTAAKKPVAKKPAAKKAVAKKTVAKKTVATKRTPAKTVAAKRPQAPKASRKAATRTRAARGGITPAQALANTRRLLEAKQAHDRAPPPWQALEERHGNDAQAGFQDVQARDQANELHAAESRMDGIHGASGAQDRHNQGKRDKR
jgi:hypothetical protein